MGLKICVVFKTHFDIGYTDLSGVVVEKYGGKMLEDVIKTCHETQKFGSKLEYVWTMAAWPLKMAIDQKKTLPELRMQAIELINRGQIRWHALPFTTHTEFCGLEELIRGLYFSKELGDTYGFYPISAKMTDVPGHTAILPSVLAAAGIKFLHLGCNPGCTMPDVPPLFWWEGPDGQRVLTFYSKGSYGSSLTPPLDWNYDTWLALMHTNDNIGPQSPEIIEEIIQKIHKTIPDAEIQIGTMDDFYHGIIKNKLDIPTLKHDLADTWIHGVGTYPKETSILRKTREEIFRAESLLTYQKIKTGDVSIDHLKESIAEVYENLILYDEHTWGLNGQLNMYDISFFDKADFLAAKKAHAYDRVENSWQEQRDRALTAAKITNDINQHANKGFNGTDGYLIFVNDGLQEGRWITLNDYELGGVEDSRTGIAVPVRRVGNQTQAFVENLPAVGTVYLSKSINNKCLTNDLLIEETDQVVTIQNSFYSISVSRITGDVISLYDKAQAHEWIDQKHPDGSMNYRYDRYGNNDITKFIKAYTYRFYDWLLHDIGRRFYPECGRKVYYSDLCSVQASMDGDSAVIRICKKGKEEAILKYGDAKENVTVIRLCAYDKAIKVGLDIVEKQETLYLDAGHFVLPLQLNQSTVTLNKLGNLIDISKDIIDDGNHALYCMENYIDVSNGTFGMTVISHDTPLCSVGKEDLLTFRSRYQESDPHLYFNLFNNIWGTNFPFYIGGSFHYDFTLISHEGNVHDAARIGEILSLSSQKSIPSNTCKNDSLIVFSTPLRILALKTALDGSNSVVLRVKEHEGKDKSIVCCIEGLKSYTECDLLENETEWIEGNQISFDIQRFGIRTYKLNF